MLDLFKEISDGQLGFKSMMLFSTSSAKALAAFGAARWSAIMLGGVFSSILVKFGGSALAHFAGNLAAFKQYGASAAESVNNPSKWASEVKGEAQVMPSMVYANAGFRNLSAAEAYDTQARLGTSMGAVGALGGGNPMIAAGSTSRANVTGLKERVAHSEAISSYASAHGVTDNQVISAIQNYQTASQGGNARALMNLARDTKSTPYEAMDLIKDTGLKEQYGKLEGLRDAYGTATDKYGYTGSFEDYVGMQAALSSTRGFTDAASVRKFSANYRDGMAGFLKDQAEFRTGQAEGMLNSLRKKRLNPGNIGEVLGALQGARNFIDSKVYSQFGDRGVEITRGGEQYNELSKMALRQAVNDIAETGSVQQDTLGVLSDLRNIREAAGQLRSQEAGTSFGISADTAHQFGEYLRRHGANVTDSELSGTTANVAWNMDKDGNLVPSMVVAKKGQKLAETDLREKDFRSVQRGQRPRAPLQRYGGVSLEAVTSKVDHGNILEVNGYDRAGNMRHMFISKNSGKVIEDDISKGPNFSKTNTISMVRQHSVPSEAFSDPGYGIAFANRFASEWGKEYSGSILRDDVTQLRTDLHGRLGLGGNSGGKGTGILGFGFGVSGKRLDYTGTKTTSQRDVIYGVTKDILARQDWSPEQKMEHLDKLNTELLKGDFFNPDRLPTKENMMNAGGLDRKQTPLSGKYETGEERDRHLKNFANKWDQPIILRPDNPPGDDES